MSIKKTRVSLNYGAEIILSQKRNNKKFFFWNFRSCDEFCNLISYLKSRAYPQVLFSLNLLFSVIIYHNYQYNIFIVIFIFIYFYYIYSLIK